MNDISSDKAADSGWVPKHSLVSREYAEIERERLWPRAWQIACREEELAKVGSYVTYDILDDSIIVVRSAPDRIQAFNNACLHRGRRLTEDCGHKARLTCRFHGWSWRLDGTLQRIVDNEDWNDGKGIDADELKLLEFKTGIWGGFVFINMDDDCEPFESFIEPVAKLLGPMQLEKHRYRWHVSVEVPANWKTTQAAFQESYHTQTTHSQIEPFHDSRSLALTHGPHGQLRFIPAAEQVIGRYRSGRGTPKDQRAVVLEFIRQTVRDLESISVDRDLQAAGRIMTELPADATYGEAMAKAGEFMREAAIATGVGFPDMNEQQIWEAGYDWTIFPNTVNVLSLTGGLWYRTRPTPDNNPDRCLLEIYALERFTPGTEPKLVKEHYTDWRDWKTMPRFLLDDFENIPEIQRGIKTRGFRGMRYNPLQEAQITNLHHAVDAFIQS